MSTSMSAAAVLLVASREVGVHESGGNNCGKRVEEYLATVGAHAGDAWCAAFVEWCLLKAGVKGWPVTGYCPNLFQWAQQRGILKKDALAGDVFLLMDADNANGAHHTGFVESVDAANGRVRTIEGNTGMASDTDGDGVQRKTRLISSCYFIRWAAVLSAAPAKPALRVTLASAGQGDLGSVVPCHPAIEDGVTRADLRPLCDALGAELELHLDDGVIVVHPKQ